MHTKCVTVSLSISVSALLRNVGCGSGTTLPPASKATAAGS